MSVLVEQRRPRCFPMTLIIDCCIPPTESTTPRFLTNLTLSDLYSFPGESVPMNPETFSAMRGGNRDYFEKKMRSSYVTPMTCLKNDKGDTILHLASAFGHVKLVEMIISESPSLLLEPNWKNQIPIHAASRAGFLDVVKTLVASVTYFSLSGEEQRRFSNVYVLKDMDGDTPLHAALKGNHLETALCLVNANKAASFLENNDGDSPLYMAVEAGGLALVKEMLKGQTSSNLASKLEGRKSLVHAALKAKNKDIIDVILNEEPSFMNERDEEGRTCLSFGVSVGYYKGVRYLLDRSTSSVFECDDDGSFPIHMAVKKGHVDVVKEILKRCPDSKELLNKQGQNILHIAVKRGKARLLIKYIKGLDKKNNHLIAEQDVDGNTPLHLATITWRPRNLRYLTKFPSDVVSKILKIHNKDGLTALDIAECNLQSNYIFRERMTLMVLLSAFKPKGYEKIHMSGMTLRSKTEVVDVKKYKDRVNALLLVATLVATVTFSAGITIPGGFNTLGMAILANDINFIFFVVADFLALHCSLVAILALIWAQFGDPKLVHRAFRLALPSLSFALTSMLFAFLYGVVATTSHVPFLGIVTNIIHGGATSLISSLIVNYVGPYIPGFRRCQWSMDTYLRVLLRYVDDPEDDISHTTSSGL